ncbi:tape measure protein [Paenibacillus sp. BK720]|uniref:tape measure protein n=1 Tax=Paenibacillus sp. BK720 TaxID=2587092 RepID=UPI00141F1924|nr:tape measure protein [Paenibacillus sp. BK720]NIK67938.1 uncharacterized protein YukE [Paenibacillus sp. BK720]
MAKEFVMGARLVLNDDFTSKMSTARNEVGQMARGMTVMHDATRRLTGDTLPLVGGMTRAAEAVMDMHHANQEIIDDTAGIARTTRAMSDMHRAGQELIGDTTALAGGTSHTSTEIAHMHNTTQQLLHTALSLADGMARASREMTDMHNATLRLTGDTNALAGRLTETARDMAEMHTASQRLKTDATALSSSMSKTEHETTGLKNANGKLRTEMGRTATAAQRIRTSFRNIGDTAQTTLDKVLSLKGAMVAVAAGEAVKNGFDWLVGGNADMEQYQNTLSVVLKSQKKAADTLQWAQTFAANTPFEIPEVVEATTKLSAYGLQAQKVLGITGDMAAVMGKSLDQAVEAIADAQTGEVERLKEFGITKKMITDEAARMGSVVVNNSGQITDQKAFNAAIFSVMQERFKGGMEMQSKTFKGMLSNASDFIGTMGRQLGKPLFDKLKKGLGSALEMVNKLKANGTIDAWIGKVQHAAGIAWNVLSAVGGVIGDVFVTGWNIASTAIDTITGKLTAFYTEHEPAIMNIGQAFMDAFAQLQSAYDTYAAPIINWLQTVGLPAVVDGIAAVGGVIVEVASWFVDNWSWIKPFVEGLAIAWGGYFLAIKIGQGVMKTISIATKAWAAAQRILNLVMSMNPMFIWITVIGLVIGAIILLITHWKQVRTFLSGIWDWMKRTAVSVFNGIVDFFKKWGLTILQVLTGPIGVLVIEVIKHWDSIKQGAVNIWNSIKNTAVSVFNSIVSWFKMWGTRIHDTITGAVGKVVSSVKTHWVTIKQAGIDAWNAIDTGMTTVWTNIKSTVIDGAQFIIDKLNGIIDKVSALFSVKTPDWMGGKEFKINLPHIPDLKDDGSHATGLKNVPFDGYRAELHEGERVLTKSENRSYDAALGSQQRQPAQQAQPVQIDKLVEKVEIHAAPGVDGKALYSQFIDEFYRQARDAAGILSSAGMGGLLNG